MSVANTLTIKDESGTLTNNYPIQIGRPFVEGEISNYPQVLINGSPITTQVDVKTRWTSDNSVKHAILSFYIPTLSANTTVTATFQNQATGNNTGYETKTNMLSASYDFNAGIILTSGTTVSAFARDMLNSDNYSYWTSGSICTTIVLADHSLTSAYDIGFDSYKSFRPIFHASFWPLINKVRIRYIGEICNTEKLQDMGFSLRLSRGYSSPTIVYTKTSFIQYLATRWTKEYWIGSVPINVSINHNVSYLANTKFIFNYDPTKIVSENAISGAYNSWISSNKDITDDGNLQKSQGAAGGRPDIGPYPDWTVRWLYTGDYRMKNQSFGNGDLSSSWPVHFREGNPNKNIQGSSNGIGKVISIRNRPTIGLFNLTYSFTNTLDKVLIVGANNSNPWEPDVAHMLDGWSPQYMLTGDYWYLEELFYWASWSTAHSNGAAYDFNYGRGPTGAEGGIPNSQVRQQAWAFRTRCHAASLTPDSFPERTYWITLIDDAIAAWEGQRGISGTSYTGNTQYNWGSTHYKDLRGYPPLHHWEAGSTDFSQADYGIDTSVVYEGASNFEQHFMMLALGRGRELGFATDSLVVYLSQFFINVLTNSLYNPYLLGNGRIPSTKISDHTYFTTWDSMKSGYDVAHSSATSYDLSDPVHGYPFIGTAATSYVSGVGSYESWDFVRVNVLSASVLDDNPKWAILPRNSLQHLIQTYLQTNNKTLRIIF